MSKFISEITSFNVFFIVFLASLKIKTLKMFGIVFKSLLPIPIPCFNILKVLLFAEAISGSGLITDNIAAPVGVVLSPSIPSSITGIFLSKIEVARAGIESKPCAVFMFPLPSGMGLHDQVIWCLLAKLCIIAAAIILSIIESHAPIS